MLLLFVICVSCYFYYTKYRPKQKHLLPFNDTSIKLGDIRYLKCIIKIESKDEFKETDIKNWEILLLFLDTTKIEYLDYDNIWIVKKSYENILVYNIFWFI